MADAEPFDPIAEAHRQWNARWPEHADHMAAVTSVMRVQQLLLARVEDALKPYGLTFASYEALRLLAFTRRARCPWARWASASWSHPAVRDQRHQAGLRNAASSSASMSPDDRRVVLATITEDGRAVARSATTALNEASFGLPQVTTEQAAAMAATLRAMRAALGDIELSSPHPAQP